MHRRNFLRNSASLLAFSPFVRQAAAASTVNSVELFESVTFKVGAVKCTVFRDFGFFYETKAFFSNAGEEELKKAAEQYAIRDGRIPSPFVSVLLEKDDRKILIDTGVGHWGVPVQVNGETRTTKGRLLQLLQKENISREGITDVVLTHFHPDHIGGLVAEDGSLNFPNATFHAHEDEWNFWYSAKGDAQPAQFRQYIQKNVTPLKAANLSLFKGETADVVAGLTALKAEGHTPGQVAVVVESGKNRLLCTSDAFLHPLHIENLHWQTTYDLDHEAAKKTRTRLLELADKERMLVNSFHFDFPGVGQVDKQEGKWIWNYAKV